MLLEVLPECNWYYSPKLPLCVCVFTMLQWLCRKIWKLIFSTVLCSTFWKNNNSIGSFYSLKITENFLVTLSGFDISCGGRSLKTFSILSMIIVSIQLFSLFWGQFSLFLYFLGEGNYYLYQVFTFCLEFKNASS